MEINLKLKPSKYKFHYIIIEFLKYIVKIIKIKVDLKKIQVILNWLIPIIVKELQLFLKTFNFN